MTLFFGLAALKRVVELSKSTHVAALPGRAYAEAIDGAYRAGHFRLCLFRADIYLLHLCG